MTQEQIKEFTLRISQANASGFVVIIYEILEQNMDDAKGLIAQHANEQAKHCIEICERYVQELIHGLNLEEPVAKDISRDYISIQRLLIRARLTLDESLINKAKELLLFLKPTFERLAREDSDAPMMEHAQKVYAGLTYGKTSLNEMAVDTMKNRGYRV